MGNNINSLKNAMKKDKSLILLKTKKDYITSLTRDREFETGKGWVSGGIDHYTLPMLKELYAVSRKKRGMM